MEKITKVYNIYSHDKSDPESDMYLICTCRTKASAKYVVDALEYRDSGGKNDNGMYDYYIKEE